MTAPDTASVGSTDVDLIAEWQAGNEGAATELVRRHTASVAKFLAASHMVGLHHRQKGWREANKAYDKQCEREAADDSSYSAEGGEEEEEERDSDFEEESEETEEEEEADDSDFEDDGAGGGGE